MKNLLFLFVLVISNSIYSQTFWHQTASPSSGTIITISINSSGYIFAGDGATGIYRSTDIGATWSQTNNGLTNTSLQIIKTKANGDLVAGTQGGGAFRSTNSGDNWVSINNGITNLGVNFFATGPNGYMYAATNGGIFRSTDNGDSWVMIDTGLTNTRVTLIVFNSIGTCFASTYGGGIFRSTDYGNNWVAINNGLTNLKIWTIAIPSDSYIFAGSGGAGVFRSTDNGDTWVHLVNYIATQQIIVSAVNSIGYVFVIPLGHGIYRSTDFGNTWGAVNTGLSDTLMIQSIGIDTNGYIYTGNAGKFYRSNNSTLPVELTSFNANIRGNKVNLKWHTATELSNLGYEIQRKTSGSKWQDLSFIKGNGTTTTAHDYSYVDNSIGFNGLYIYRLKQIDNNGNFVLSNEIGININIIPNKFLLDQNYPNPFNPSTIIRFTIPSKDYVSIYVYDILGRKIETLINEEKLPGEYKVNFDGHNLSSGVYIYRLTAGKLTEAKQMILIK